LPQIVSDYCQDPIVGIIPELPIRLGTVKAKYATSNFADRSYKVDFYLLGSHGTNYLIEFKTDSGSRRNSQDCYLQEARQVGMKSLIEGIISIAKVSSYKNKYNHLLNKLLGLGIINSNIEFSGKSVDISIIYVQPHTSDNDKCIDFKWISTWIKQNDNNDEFATELANTLESWSE
jgi:hypothetical protein